MSDVVNKLWGFCHTLRHDGIDYGDYIEQLTFLLFLKMAEESAAEIPKSYDWASLKVRSGTDLMDHYGDILRKLREVPGLLQDIFAQAVPRFNNPVNLKKVINLIDEEDWSSMEVDVKGAAFEGLLEKAASEGKEGSWAVFHASCAHRRHRAGDEAGPTRKDGFQNLRSCLWDRRILDAGVRVADEAVQRRHRPQRHQADQDEDVFRPRFGSTSDDVWR